MKLKRDYADYLNDMVRFARKAREFIGALDVRSFAGDDEKALAVAYALQIIGEAAHRLPETLKQRYGDVPWANIVGMRNLIAHGYYWWTRKSSGRLLVMIFQHWSELLPTS
jgi:uncharacterized protein with HEPN domain